MVAQRFPLADNNQRRFSKKGNSSMNPPVGFTDPVSVASKVYKYHRFDPELVEQLVSIYRIMFPHNSIPDEFYEHVVRKLDDKAAQDQNLPSFLSEGVEATKDRPMIKADISIVASTTSIGSKERSFNLCHERLIWMTVAWF